MQQSKIIYTKTDEAPVEETPAEEAPAEEEKKD